MHPQSSPAKDVSRFWAAVEKSDSCWLWTAHIRADGYGGIRWRGKNALAHRVSWEFHHGAAPALCVLHRCDNRRCVNPSHLFLGTRQDNMADMVAKGRSSHGERNYNAKLTDEQVAAIRQASGVQRAIATRFGIHQSHVCKIKNGQRWHRSVTNAGGSL